MLDLPPSPPPMMAQPAVALGGLVVRRSVEYGRSYHANSMLVGEGEASAPRRLTAGWAGVVRFLVDGRRQIVHLLLSGDLLETGPWVESAAASPIFALTKSTVSSAGVGGEQERLAQIERTLWCMQNQICRIGRQSAYERLANLFAELRDRLALAGQASGDTFEMPLTQDILGDTLGLTSVHINRTLQQMRRDGLIRLSGRTVSLLDRAAIERIGEFRRMPRS